MANKSGLGLNKETLDKVLSQAKASVKVIESLQKEGIDRAKNYIHIPSKEARRRFADEKILAGLKKLGLATREEVQELNDRLEDLASELRSQISKINKKDQKEASAKTKEQSL